MKRFVLLAMALAVALEAVAVVVPKGEKIPRSRRQRRSIEELGGRMVRPYNGPAVKILNMQQIVGADVLESVADEMMAATRIPIFVGQSTDDAKPVESLLDGNAAAVVAVRAHDGRSTIVVAPENGWCEVNVKALSLDSPSPEILNERVRKEVWRAAAIMLGAGNSNFQPCLMTTVLSLKDLDAVRMRQPCPEPYGKMSNTATRLGCGEAQTTSYRQACREGWAPSPTNDVQRAIWEEMSTEKERGPTNPRPIRFKARKR